MTGSVQERAEALLAEVPHERIEHGVSRTAEEAAAARGTVLHEGGKAIVMKLHGRGFVLIALRGSDALSGRLLRQAFGVQRYRFATREELLALTGLEPGCVPPLGRPVLELPLFVDAALAGSERVVFTLGAHTCSARLATGDWLQVARPEAVLSLTESG
jgi:prolyl-tRNA editing enzyme YbaK/EbsC (Cys-tRNA(Pro) deacylase)